MVRISAVHYEHYGLDLPPLTTFPGANRIALRKRPVPVLVRLVKKALRKLTKLAQKQPDCTYPFFNLISHEPDVTVKPVKLKSLTPSEQYVDLLADFCGYIDFTRLPEHITNVLKQYYIYVESDLYYYLSLENAPLLPGLTEADFETLRE